MSKVRLNIYVVDPAIRKHVKTAAAQHDMTVSGYCLQAMPTILPLPNNKVVTCGLGIRNFIMLSIGSFLW